MNNANVEEYAADTEARWGAKGKNNIWFGHKLHQCVDMRFGLIAKLRATPGNVLDNQVIKSVLPASGTAFCDKLYDTKAVHQILKAHGIPVFTLGTP